MNVFESNLGHRLVEKLIVYLDKEKRIDWEQRRYEIASNLFAKAISDLSKNDSGVSVDRDAPRVAAHCVLFADKLIEELKKK